MSQSFHLSKAINETLDVNRRKKNLIDSGIMPISQEFLDVTLVKELLEDPVLYQCVKGV